ncbi:hypothetical protein HS088_TW21G01197 [Tripterygium wilfordii]|uniref:AT hook motif-containing protein n=1 Tax=Tripterygium wilfordii TaxID=458696 RepID=A0A7J7C4G8_TRIWF|nr:uncharacterized protein LOC119988359 [Tripterygium wilfordii]XP_038689294.1 uncharacterized protein LOC119988359 [Tripterygium wilfordii]KAF5729040.1 hypothetical protein HS088_TW21G01197 [Tripterygium wilfordii]
MSQQRQGTGSPVEAPAKRKRGRPRKDENLVPVVRAATSGADSRKKNTQSSGASGAVSVRNEVVGQLVSGVVEGSFNDGYLINVKLSNSNVNLRGAVFLPGRSIPITAANDVAPQIPMIDRVEIDITSPDSQTKLHGSVSLVEQSDKAPSELNSKVCRAPGEDKPADPQSGIPSSSEKEPTSVILPLVDSIQVSAAGLSSGEKIKPPIAEFDSGNQSASVLVQSDPKVFEQNDMVIEASGMEKVPNTDEEMTGGSKQDGASASITENFPGTETAQQEFLTPSQGGNSEVQHNDSACDGPKSPDLEANKPPAFAEPEVISEPIGINISLENQPSSMDAKPEEDTPQELATNIVGDGNTSNLNRTAASDSAVITDTNSLSPPVVPSEPSLVAEGPVLPTVMEPEICASPGAANILDCNTNDTIAPTEL